ncbi:hypothetical protein SPRG_09598 [Saprolegnia parasitica CBS 223.65]|uniref:Uncharacterized protein n=1 Tax=Saprolegnia parasitica (strain CBS 223.65) TaxID=695850 RepID=A0A067C338_SAPPC|nr:hypothetical protein SPRG_09598 [Saprolegnia parasitica CBS 223.65]KDO24953.1 hypothetical protein SPRG_09598 [Saprolegnia parasitica CBS 223.65]|eukprot:XP_012204413.1 hypothetical protein SPRG_09598 [Saprolegnia parasitica CBS 223.65]
MAAVDCAFHVKYCEHDAVFEPHYTRYQKAQKVKVPSVCNDVAHHLLAAARCCGTTNDIVCGPVASSIRCFPHCCPRHAHYRYCGAPLVLQTTYAARVTGTYASLLRIAPAHAPDWDLGFETPPLSATSLHSAAATWHAGHQEVVSETQHVLASSFNVDLADGWTYGWKSSRSQAIRDCRHHVTAYVFEMTPRGMWRLVAKATSPGFTIATYRSSSAPCDDAVVMPAPEHETSTALVSSRTQRMAYHLGLLLLYVDQVETVSAASQHKLVQYLLHASPVPVSCAMHQLLVQSCSSNQTTGRTSRVLVDWLVHLLHPHNRRQYEAVVRSHRDCILQRTDLARAYSDCVQLLHSVSEAFLAKQHETSVAQIALEALASLPSLSTEMTRRLLTESFFVFGYQACVAHFREVALSAEAAQSVWPEHRVLGSMRARSWLCGDWVCDAPSVHVASQNGWQLSAATLVRWASSLFHVRTTLLGPQLHVQSVWRVYVSQPTCFALDGRPHVHRTWPNGESTMAGATRYLGTSRCHGHN